MREKFPRNLEEKLVNNKHSYQCLNLETLREKQKLEQ
jgi:hypothetical protein